MSMIYTWDMGDGTIYTGQTVSHTYTQPGDYIVTLSVEDTDTGDISTKTGIVKVNINDEYIWDFGDGTLDTGINVQHTYEEEGVYDATLSVMNTVVDSKTITVNSPVAIVDFNTGGGSTIESQTVEQGSTISEPEDPAREGYQFDGWYTDTECTVPWNFSLDTVEGDMILYAKWIDLKDLQYIFSGWFKDPDFTTPWDFANDTVTEDTTLYAKWDLLGGGSLKDITLNTFELLDSFNSDELKIHDRIITNNKRCVLYENGRVILETVSKLNVFHIDTFKCTGFGFVKNDDDIIRIYTCSDGVLSIIDVENNDIKRIALPSNNYHVFENSVKLYNDDTYAIIGIQKEIDSQEVRDAVKRNEYKIIEVNDNEYILTKHTLYKSETISGDVSGNIGTSMVRHSIFGDHIITDFSISDDNITVICNDGQVLRSDNDGLIQNFQTKLSYNPGIDIRSTNDIHNYLKLRITDYAELKNHNIFEVHNNVDANVARRFFHYCGDNKINHCDIYPNNEAIVYKTDNDGVIDTNVKMSVISDVSFDGNLSDNTFNYPDRVTFSNDGEVIAISRGKKGLVLVKNGEVTYIHKNLGFKPDSEVSCAKFGDDGYLYIGLKNQGYVLRNSHKDDYTTFYDIISSSLNTVDASLDTNTEVSNIISTDNGIWFYCNGSHTLNDPVETIYNNGLFHYNSKIDRLTKVESFDNSFTVGYKRLFFSYGKVMVQNDINRIDFYDQYTLQRLGEYANEIVTDRRIWDIVFYNNDLLMYVSDPISTDIYLNKLISRTDTLTLDTITVNNDKHNVSESYYKLPYISDITEFEDYTVLVKLVSNDKLHLYNIDSSNNLTTMDIDIPCRISETTRINISKDSDYVYINMDDVNVNPDKYFYWKYDCKNNSIHKVDKSIINKSEINTIIDDKIICKSLSKTNIGVSEGFIFGDNSISDFGAVNTRFVQNPYKGTKSFMVTKGLGNRDEYFDRITGESIDIRDIINLKPDYTYVMGLGIGCNDCKVYLALNDSGGIRLLQEYVTNNRDIVDINVKNVTSETSDIVGYDLLGEATPGNTKFSNVDYWYIGDINNCAVGFKFTTDGGGNKTRYIDKLVFLGVKKKYVIDPTPIKDIEIPDDIQILDDSLSSFKMYSKEFGSYYISVTDNECKIVDIFSRYDNLTYPWPETTSIFAKGKNIDFEKYFKSKTNFVKYGDLISQRNKNEVFVEDFNINHRQKIDGLTLQSDSDGYYIVNSIREDTNIDHIPFMKYDENIENLDMIDDGYLIFYIELDNSYGSLKYDRTTNSILNALKFISHDTGGLNPEFVNIDFTKDPNRDNIYFVSIHIPDTGPDRIVDYSKLVLTNYNVNTHNTRFRVWSHIIHSKSYSRSSIGPVGCVDSWGDEILFSDPKLSYDNINTKFLIDSLMDKYSINNTVINSRNKFSVIMKLIPDTYAWFVHDIFELFKMNDFKLLAQLADRSSTVADINIDIEGISDYTPTSIQLNLLDGSNYGILESPLLIKIDFEYFEESGGGITISMGQSGNMTEIINKSDHKFPIDTFNFDILNSYCGEIENVTISNGDYSLDFNIDEYIGDNVYGNVVSMVRDHISGNINALVSPNSFGDLRDKGILKYILNHNSSEFDQFIVEEPINDLRYGDVGFHENSAFTIISTQKENGNFSNIYKRKYPEKGSIPKLKFLLSAKGRYINNSKNKIVGVVQ